jgi:hypothetical protein
MAETAITPAAPAGAQRVVDFSALDQARSNQVRLAMVELERRFPSGAQAELQMWTLPASATWQLVRDHYGAQKGWAEVADQRAESGPLLPNTQIYADRPAQQRLAVLLFPARRDAESDSAVLLIQRAARTPTR